MNFVRAYFLSGSCALLATLGGCGSKPPEVVEVTGVVTLNGEPLEHIHVEFWPLAGPRSIGNTDETGAFELTTDDLKRFGCLPGESRVALKDTHHMKDDYISEGGDWVDMSAGRKSRIHSKYFDAMKSPLTVEVKLGETNYFEFAVDPRP